MSDTGLRRFIFVRNKGSLAKPQIQSEIDAIHAAVPEEEAHEFTVVDGDAYSRPRRENLCRMHHDKNVDGLSSSLYCQAFSEILELHPGFSPFSVADYEELFLAQKIIELWSKTKE